MNEYVEAKDQDIITDPTERFIIKLSDIKQSMGLWYSLFLRRIVPFMLFFIPTNVIVEHVLMWIKARYPNDFITSEALFVCWTVVLLVFLALLIFAGKVATVAEFGFGFVYLFLAFRHHLFNNLLGYSVLFGMILFLIVKSVFLVFEIIRLKTFSGDKANNIERDDSGRAVRATDEKVFFTKEKEDDKKDAVVSYDDVYFVKDDANVEQTVRTVDEDFFFAQSVDDRDKDVPERMMDNDFYFGSDNSAAEDKISSSDEDYFFG